MSYERGGNPSTEKFHPRRIPREKFLGFLTRGKIQLRMDNNNPKIVSLKGLSAREAKRLLRIHGENIIYRKNRIRPILTFIKKLNSPLFLTLSGVAVLSLFLGEKTNSVIILVMISLSATLDFWNSYWSEKAVGRLTVKVSSTATVLRDGVRREVPFKFVMPGDLIFLSAGDIVPADATILEANNLFVNESALTGESFPAGKTEKPPQNAVRMGTSVVAGLASARVTSIGFNTEFGKIAEHMATNPPETDFEKGIREFSFFIMKVTFVLVVFVFLVNAIFGRDILTSLLFAIAIAIGLTPELLPIIMSVGFSRGSIRMAKRDVIVKNLSSIQSFGSMNVLCTDKTGTLTEDHIVLVRYTDGFGRDYEPVLRFAYLSTKFHSAVRSPLDDAIAEHKPPDEISGYRKIYEVPFDFERKRNSVAVKNKEGAVLITKGAPEEMIKVSSYYEDGEGFRTCTNAIKDKIMEQFRFFSADGFRVLGVAIKNVDGDKTEFTSADEFGMTFCGFIIFIDPPKPTAKDALLALNALGVNVKILTGDSEILTQKICRDIGLPVKKVITGSELEKMSAEKLLLNVRETTVFARINPIQKERVIIALKKTGHSVGYLGDGINDAPALVQADVGIAMATGTDVAMESAGITLLHGDLSKFVKAVRLARLTMRGVRQNLFWAFFYNVVGIPIAAGLLYPIWGIVLNPIFAGMAMALSSVSVVGNSLRLKVKKI